MSLLITSWILATVAAATSPELGDVAWSRDFDAAVDTARAAQRPLLVLFDEVPGCQTCVSYGQAVLSHPLLVEAAETLFVPVAVFNNVAGADRRVLERFDEPAWNNPVVRVVDVEGRDLVPRLTGDYRVEALASRMAGGLRASGRAVPRWLALLAAEADPATTVYAGMACFWSGEACLGSDDDVLATRTGWMGGHEVVELRVRRGRESEVLASAAVRGCAARLFSDDSSVVEAARAAGLTTAPRDRFRPTPSDDRHRLGRARLRALPLTPLQATRVNADLVAGRAPERWLSPSQRQLADRLSRARDDVVLPDPRASPDLRAAMARLEAVLAEATARTSGRVGP